MSSQNIRKMVTTAVLIALSTVFQLLRPVLGGSNIISTYIIGSLVNVCLIIAACVVALWSGAAVAVITPLIALWQGHAQAPMVPWIIAGNLALAILFALLVKKDSGWVRWCIVGVVAALVKYLIIALGQTFVLTSAKGLAFGAAFGTAAAAQVVQIVTAIIGMVLAKLLVLAMPRSVTSMK